MREREKLLSFLRTKEKLPSVVSILKDNYLELKDDYLEACKSKPPIYISDHSMVRFLQRVKGERLTGVSDWDKVYEYLRRKGRYSKDLREEIFSKEEMQHIVANEIERYEKNGYVYIVKGLTLITIYIKEEKNEPNSNNDDHTPSGDSNDRRGNDSINIQHKSTHDKPEHKSETTHTKSSKHASAIATKTTGGNPGRRARNIRSLSRDTYDSK